MIVTSNSWGNLNGKLSVCNGNIEWRIQIYHSDLGTPLKHCVFVHLLNGSEHNLIYSTERQNKRRNVCTGVCKVSVCSCPDTGSQGLHLVSVGTEFCEDICCSKPTHSWNSILTSSIFFLPAGIKLPDTEALKLYQMASYISVLVLSAELAKLLPCRGRCCCTSKWDVFT